jgi:hypothetical protein
VKEPRTYGREFQLQGQAAVWQVASQLALRGHNILFPGLDEGYDLQLDNGLRLQVKSSTLLFNHAGYPYGAYCFGLRRGAWDRKDRKYKRSTIRKYSEVADFFVLWGIEENRFFILPTSDKRQSIWFQRRGTISKSNNRFVIEKEMRERMAEAEDRWDLLDIESVQPLIDGTTEEIEKIQQPESLSLPFENKEKL